MRRAYKFIKLYFLQINMEDLSESILITCTNEQHEKRDFYPRNDWSGAETKERKKIKQSTHWMIVDTS